MAQMPVSPNFDWAILQVPSDSRQVPFEGRGAHKSSWAPRNGRSSDRPSTSLAVQRNLLAYYTDSNLWMDVDARPLQRTQPGQTAEVHLARVKLNDAPDRSEML